MHVVVNFTNNSSYLVHKKKWHEQVQKTRTKRIPVEMGAAKSSETSERPMTDPCLLCLFFATHCDTIIQ